MIHETRPDNMTNSRCKLDLGNNRYIQVSEWKEELRVDLREWNGDVPTKKGISLTLLRYKNLIDGTETIDKALQDKESYQSHLGGNVYCTVNGSCVDIRKYWKPEEEVVPTKKGLCLRPFEYQRLKELITEIGLTLPELDAVVPCGLQSDHMNQLGALSCPECNPNDCHNW